MRHRIEIEFLSDTCFSMPAAENVCVDVDVTTDADGLPMISGKTLHGLLRDTWLSAHICLDRNVNGGWIGEKLLGRPKSHELDGIVRIGDARCDEGTRQWIRRLHYESRAARLPAFALRDAFLLQRALTAEDREAGTPKTDTLRIVRTVPKGTVMCAALETIEPLNDEQKKLLIQLVDLTRHAGIDRNRGLGHIRMRLLFAEKPVFSAPMPPFTAPTGTSSPRFLHYRLTLTAPCLITGNDLDPNSRQSKPVLAGATLRGALAAALQRAQKREPMRSEDDKIAELETILASGRVRLLSAYPEIDGERALPTPITWQRTKDARYDDTEKKVDPQDAVLCLYDPESYEPKEKQCQPLETQFFAAVKGEYRRRDVPMRHATHQSRNRASGIATKDRSTVFVYEALAPEQSFRGCLVAPPEIEARLRTLFAPPFWLGRSARAGYGGAPDIEFLSGATPLAEQSDASSAEAVLIGDRIGDGKHFTIRLTSPAVLRDSTTGQHDPWMLGHVIEERIRQVGLQDAMEIVAGPEGQPMVCVEAGTAKGFNRLWRTEIPALPCAAAGSVALLQAKRDISRGEIILLQQEPLGERIAEGLGCFVVAPANQDLTLKEEKSPPAPILPAGDPPTTLMSAQKRLYRKRLQALLTDLALDQAENLRGSISVGLLQRLRVPLRDTATFQETYLLWLGKKKLPDVRPMQTETLNTIRRTSVSGTSLFDLLSNVEQSIESTLNAATEAEERQRFSLIPPSLLFNTDEGSPAQKLEALWKITKKELLAFYVDTLLSACARHKRRQAETAGRTEDAAK